MELTEPDRPSPEIVTPDLYLTEESIAIRALVDELSERALKKLKKED